MKAYKKQMIDYDSSAAGRDFNRLISRRLSVEEVVSAVKIE